MTMSEVDWKSCLSSSLMVVQPAMTYLNKTYEIMTMFKKELSKAFRIQMNL